MSRASDCQLIDGGESAILTEGRELSATKYIDNLTPRLGVHF